MKIAVYSNDVKRSLENKKKLVGLLIKNGFVYDNENPEVVITLGGDGTLLTAFHHYEKKLDNIRFTAINTGHLGFYTDWQDNEIEELVESLKKDNGELVGYPLLRIKTYFNNGKLKENLALNECTLQKITSTLIADIYYENHIFEHFRGEGLCISTPTGSTAYNKSVGGAVVNSGLKVLQLTEIASINNVVHRTLGSPVIIGPEDKLTIVPSPKTNYFLTIDSESFRWNQISKIEFSLNDNNINFVKYRHINFWKRVQKSFIGEL